MMKQITLFVWHVAEQAMPLGNVADVVSWSGVGFIVTTAKAQWYHMIDRAKQCMLFLTSETRSNRTWNRQTTNIAIAGDYLETLAHVTTNLRSTATHA